MRIDDYGGSANLSRGRRGFESHRSDADNLL